jgi:hypothetical protein
MKKILLSLFLVILICSAAGAGTLLVFKGKRLPLLNKIITIPFLEKNPDDVFAKMMAKMEDMKSYENNSEFTVKLTGQNNSDDNVKSSNSLSAYDSLVKGMAFKLNFNAKVDNNDAQSIKNETQFNFSFNAGGMALDTSGKIIVIDKKTYFNAQLPTFFPFLPMDQYSNRWFVIDQEKIQQEKGKLNSESFGMYGSFLPTDINIQKEIEDKTIKEIEASLAETKIIKISERLPDEKIEGVNCYHYKIYLDKNNLHTFSLNLIKILASVYDKKLPIDDAVIDENISKFLNAVVKSEGEIWIDKNEYWQKQVIFDLAIDSSKIIDNINTSFPSPNYLVDIYVKNTFLNYNQAEKIEAPASSTDLLDLINKQLEASRKKARDAERLSDTRQIQTALELYYSVAGKYPDEVLPDEKIAYQNNTFILKVPKNPLPSDDGCPANFEYNYKVKDNGKSYELTYCLAEEMGNKKAGINTLTPESFNNIGATSKNYEALVNSSANDKDGDGLTNDEEKKYKTNPNLKDTDGDGLWDYEEIYIYKTDPLKADTDGDGFKDGSEVKSFYNPKGKGKISNVFASPEYALRKIESDLVYSDLKAYFARAHKSPEYTKFIKDEFGLTIDEFDKIFEKKVLPSIPVEDMINYTKLDQIDKTHVKFEYVATYKPSKDIFQDSSREDESYLIKDGKEWYLDVLTEFKEIKKNDSLNWKMQKAGYLKSNNLELFKE